MEKEKQTSDELALTAVSQQLGLAVPVVQYWDSLMVAKEKEEEAEEKFRKAVLSAMSDYGVLNFTIGDKYQFIRTGGKETVESFDTDSFVSKEPKEIIDVFSTKTKKVDVDKLLAEHPDLAEKYSSDAYEVDTKSLKKALPEVYNKYITLTQRDKRVMLQVKKVKAKEEKKD